MNNRRAIILLATLCFEIILLLGNSGCANIIPPAGGPKDSIPPILVKSNPADSIRNFNGNKLTFTFNEFVELQSPQENIVISPLPKVFPTVEYRLNTVTVKLKDSLESNTTYRIQFGDAIKDFTEGNVLKGFSYTFSTGPYIDSLELEGDVILAETGKIDTTLIVMLHNNSDDSAVVKERPRYIAKLDSRGHFIFKNLPPKTFYLYALKDESGTRRYFKDNQLFAFASNPVNMASNKQTYTLYAYASKAATPFPVTNAANRIKNVSTAAERRLRYATNMINMQQDLVSRLTISFDLPLRNFDSTKLRLYTDSIYTPAAGYKWMLDSTRKQVTLLNEWVQNKEYHLVLDKDFAEDTTGRKLLKTDTLTFHTRKLADYGSLKLRFRNLDLAKNPVLLVMNGETIYKSYTLAGNELSEAIFLPGDYELRLLFDSNKNGKWDPGEFFGKHKQPEIVKSIDRKISVKASFQNEFDISL